MNEGSRHLEPLCGSDYEQQSCLVDEAGHQKRDRGVDIT